MSSMRNVVQRRNHKERAQPQGREKWGILEKHKDYSLRAADYNLKKKKLNILKEKARDRNPDEFAFGMLSADKSRQGKHGRNSTEHRLSHDTVKLLKTQDQGYLRTIGQKSRRELEDLEKEIKVAGILDSKAAGNDVNVDDEDMDDVPSRSIKGGKKIIFVDTSEQEPMADSTQENGNPTDGDDFVEATDNLNPTEPSNHTPKQLKRTQQALQNARLARKKRKRLNDIRAAKLQALKVRQKEIMTAADALEAQRARMHHSVGGVNKDGVKFKVRERKR